MGKENFGRHHFSPLWSARISIWSSRLIRARSAKVAASGMTDSRFCRRKVLAISADMRNSSAVAVGATIYFGSEQSRRQIVEVSQAFEYAHELGMATILWCYLRNSSFKKDGTDYHAAADLTGQANHIGVTIKADIVKQKLPSNNGGFKAIGFGKTNERMYSELTTDHPIDLCRYQVANGYMGRVGLINSGGESHGESDLHDAVVTAVVNKRAGGMGLISGRKAFQKPMKDGVQLLNTIQDVYLDSSITIA